MAIMRIAGSIDGGDSFSATEISLKD